MDELLASKDFIAGCICGVLFALGLLCLIIAIDVAASVVTSIWEQKRQRVIDCQNQKC